MQLPLLPSLLPLVLLLPLLPLVLLLLLLGDDFVVIARLWQHLCLLPRALASLV